MGTFAGAVSSVTLLQSIDSLLTLRALFEFVRASGLGLSSCTATSRSRRITGAPVLLALFEGASSGVSQLSFGCPHARRTRCSGAVMKDQFGAATGDSLASVRGWEETEAEERERVMRLNAFEQQESIRDDVDARTTPPAGAGILSGLAKQVSKPWFPLVIFAMSLANCFIVFLSGGVTALYISACVSKGPRRFIPLALCNALGALAGFTVFALLVEKRGVDWVRETYPDIFTSRHWNRTEAVMKSCGWSGCVGISAMPFPLHAFILLGMLTGMSREAILGAVFLGRLFKYAVFGWAATSSPGALRYFGVKVTGLKGGKGDEKKQREQERGRCRWSPRRAAQ